MLTPQSVQCSCLTNRDSSPMNIVHIRVSDCLFVFAIPQTFAHQRNGSPSIVIVSAFVPTSECWMHTTTWRPKHHLVSEEYHEARKSAQGPHSLRFKTSYCKLQDMVFKWSYHNEIWQLSWHHCCQYASKVVDQYDSFEPISHSFEISWDLVIRTYRKTSSISRTKPQNLNVSHLVLQLSLPNSLKPNVKLRMKM